MKLNCGIQGKYSFKESNPKFNLKTLFSMLCTWVSLPGEYELKFFLIDCFKVENRKFMRP